MLERPNHRWKFQMLDHSVEATEIQISTPWGHFSCASMGVEHGRTGSVAALSTLLVGSTTDEPANIPLAQQGWDCCADTSPEAVVATK